MKRSRLVLSSSFFGSVGGDVASFSALAERIRADAVCMGPAFGGPPADLLRRSLAAHHLRLEAAENVWVEGSGEGRHERGETLSDPDAGERTTAIRLTAASAGRVARLGGGILAVRLGRVTIPDGVSRFEALKRAVLGETGREGTADEAARLARDVAEATVGTLDRVCRALFEVLRLTEGEPVRLGIVTGEPLVGIPGPEMLECILEDLHSPRLSYWHDPVRAYHHDLVARRLWGRAEEGKWLGRHARRLAGVFLHDARGLDVGLPPGSGGVDWKALREHLPSEACRVVRLAPGAGAEALSMGFGFLRDLGLD